MSDSGAPGFPLPASRFRLHERIGAGGMGEVWRADDLARGRVVAVKRLRVAGGGEPADRLRFKREFLILSRLALPGIVRAHDYLEVEGEPVYTMDWVRGVPLHVFLSGGAWRNPPAPAPDFHATAAGLEALWDLAGGLLDTLSGLHAEGLVHRDLKPANVLVDETGRPRLIDFGLARPAGAALEITGVGEVMGTPSYLAPEQVRAEPLDGRTDLYALGVMLYELATGRLPFAAASVGEVLVAHLQQAPDAPRARNPALSPDCSAWLLRLLAKEPARRFPSAMDALRALAAAREARPGAVQLSQTLALEAPARPATPGALLRAPHTGNRAARAVLAEALGAVAGGTGGVVLVAGEAGAGKSMLGAELRRMAADAGVKVLAGAAREAGNLPGQLFQDLFAGWLERGGNEHAWLRESMGGEGPALAHHFPALRRLPGCEAPPPPLEGEAERGRLLAALYALFTRACARRPVALLLEDLHWADPLSLELAAHLLANFAAGSSAPLFALVNYRPGEAAANERVKRWLGQFGGDGVRRLALEPLPAEDCGELIAALLGLPDPPPAPFSAHLRELTGGNPHFLTETVRALVSGGELRPDDTLHDGSGWNFSAWLARARAGESQAGRPPPSVADAVLRRIAALPEPARDALELAALIGREFRFAWWLHAAGGDEDSLIEIADRAIRAGLLRELAGDRLAFTHDQLRGALAAAASGLKRRRLHGRIADGLAADPARGEGGDLLLAEHALEAGQREAALDRAPAMIRWLLERHDADAAGRLFDRLEGLLAGSELAPAARLEIERLAVRVGLGRAADDALPARADAAIALAGACGDAATGCELLIDAMELARKRGENPRALDYGERALAAAQALGDEGRVANVLGLLAVVRFYLGDHAGAFAALDRSEEIATPRGDRRRLFFIANARAVMHYARSELAACERQIEESIRLAEAIDYRRGQGTALGNLGSLLLETGRPAQAEAATRRALQLDREVGNRAGMTPKIANLINFNNLRGDHARAAALHGEHREFLEQYGSRHHRMDFRVFSGESFHALGDLARGRALFAEAIEGFAAMGYAPGEADARASRMRCELWWGDESLAREELPALSRVVEGGRLADFKLVERAAALLLAEPGGDDAEALVREAAATGRMLLEFTCREYAARAAARRGDAPLAARLLGDAPARARAGGFLVVADRLDAIARDATGIPGP